MKQNQTPIDSFINHKANAIKQCGNYSIDIPKPKENEQYRFHFDTTACVGCHCCETACNEQNNNDADVKWRRVGELESGTFPNVSQLFNSMSCNHCLEPTCLIACPTNSYIKFDNGIVFHEDDSCIGCSYCTWNCAYEVPVMNYDRGIITKCDMCHEKLEIGETPACVQACPAGAIEIELVNVKQWLEKDMQEQGIAPHLPDINISKPTTRYTLADNLSEKFTPSDEHITAQAHGEIPLVFMTVLTQAGVGAIVLISLAILFGVLSFTNVSNIQTLSFIAILPVLIGLPLSALHLGRPLMAYKAILNIKTSWLSREALALGLFAALLTPIIIISSENIVKILLFISSIIGLYGIYSQVMIYRIKARPSWDMHITNKSFFATFYLGFIFVSLILLIQEYTFSSTIALIIAISTAIYQLKTISEENNFYNNLKEEDNNYYQLNKTKTLRTNNLKSYLKYRIKLLIIFAIVIPLFLVFTIQDNNFVFSIFFMIIVLIGSLISELLGRYIFYSQVVSLGLAGNFFAGNQRTKNYKGTIHA